MFGLPKVRMNRSTQSIPSEIGVPLGDVTENATASGPLSRRISSNRPAISASASSHPICTQPGSSAVFGVVRRSGWVSRRGLCTISGAARPFGHNAAPVGCDGSGATESSRSPSTVYSAPQRERHNVQYPCRTAISTPVTGNRLPITGYPGVRPIPCQGLAENRRCTWARHCDG